MTHLYDTQDKIWEWAKRKGWNDKPIPYPEQVALIHSEVSEALEAYRDGVIDTVKDEHGKPIGYFSELADAVIRICHYFSREGRSLQEEIDLKMAYNEEREYRHGGKEI